MSATVERKTYRGRSLEDVLPLIRAELGPEAVITKQRDGVVGGIGGFFGKRCIEVEAEAPAGPALHADPGGTSRPPVAPALPPRRVLDAYDAGGEIAPSEALAESTILSALIAGTSPFADHLDQADQRIERAVRAAVLAPEPPAAAAAPVVAAPVSVEPPAPVASAPALVVEPEPGLVRAAPLPPPERPEEPLAAGVHDALVAAAIPPPLAAELVREVELHVRPLEPAEPLTAQVRKALARRIRVASGWTTERRTIAVVGAAGAGKTTVAAKLCHAYASAGQLSVAALSLEGADGAERLATLTDHLDLDLRAAATPAEAARAIRRLAREELVVVDTPAVSAGDQETIVLVGDLLDVVRPDEVHLVVPATTDARAAKALADALGRTVEVTQIVVARTDEGGPVGGPVGLALSVCRPVSYVASGRDVKAGLRPADPGLLASLVLP
ncbi:MAG: hypothetical protein R3C15_19400 [Thermoleophilia bacterium]